MTQIFCSNEPCEAEATCHLITDRGTRCPLCATCREAFEWGQASPDGEIQDIDQHTDEEGAEADELEDDQQLGYRYPAEHNGGVTCCS